MTDAPQFLYHGTSAMAARKALVEGLRPRSIHGRTNWKHSIESNPKTVYLTDAYPIYFASHCAHKRGGQGAVLQLATDRVSPLWLVPDEDVLEQAGRGKDGVDGSMKERTRYYRDLMINHIGTDTWKTSLQAMGTCGSMQPISPAAITRVAWIDFNECRQLDMDACDAMIMLANYQFCGAKYRNMTNRLFGLPLEEDALSQLRSTQLPSEMDEHSRAMLEQLQAGHARHEELLNADYAKVRIEEINP